MVCICVKILIVVLLLQFKYVSTKYLLALLEWLYIINTIVLMPYVSSNVIYMASLLNVATLNGVAYSFYRNSYRFQLNYV